MNRLWAPWRKAYLRPKDRKDRGCLFCRILAEGAGRDIKNFVVKRTASSFALLNLYPYNNGHVMVLPMRHADSLSRLTARERLDWLALYDEVLAAIKKTLRPHGFNVGMNLGRVAGAGVPHHLHLHVVPRWKGDENFMPVIGETKVISESLDSVYASLAKALRRKKR